jgi:hypothetical protein
MDHDGVRIDRGLRDRLEVLERVVGHLLVQADVAAGAGTVLDHHRLAPLRLQLLAEHTRGDVGRATWGERHDDLHRLGREPVGRILGLRCADSAHHEQGSELLHHFSFFR